MITMKPLTLNAFNKWLELYGLASKENNAKASAELFALDARYDESPFDVPIIGRQPIPIHHHRLRSTDGARLPVRG